MTGRERTEYEKENLENYIPYRRNEYVLKAYYLNRKKNGVKWAIIEVVRKNLTEFIWECIMTIDHEKENGTLTDLAGKD